MGRTGRMGHGVMTAALALLWSSAAAADPRALQVACAVTNSAGRVAIVARVDNVSGAPLQGVDADRIVVTSIGSASLLIQVEPRAVREVSAGRRAELQWSGRAYGDGYLNVAVQVSARDGRGAVVSSGMVGCPRAAVGDPRRVGGMTPGSTRPCAECHNGAPDPASGSWTPARAQTAASRATPTPTRRVSTPTFTRTPTSVRRATPTFTRTLAPARRPTPTRTRIPTATSRPTRTPRGGGGGPALPDLAVDQTAVRNTLMIETRTFHGDECPVADGCVGGLGRRRLLRFTTITPNLGSGDFVLGNPAQSSLFEYNECQQRYDVKGFWDFRLQNFAGETVATGVKHAWCLVDLFPLSAQTRPQARFESCGNEGISAGWGDVYARNMDCQWVDITGVPAGDYVLDVEVNPDRRIRESNYGNNTSRTEVHIPPDVRR